MNFKQLQVLFMLPYIKHVFCHNTASQVRSACLLFRSSNFSPKYNFSSYERKHWRTNTNNIKTSRNKKHKTSIKTNKTTVKAINNNKLTRQMNHIGWENQLMVHRNHMRLNNNGWLFKDMIFWVFPLWCKCYKDISNFKHTLFTRKVKNWWGLKKNTKGKMIMSNMSANSQYK